MFLPSKAVVLKCLGSSSDSPLIFWDVFPTFHVILLIVAPFAAPQYMRPSSPYIPSLLNTLGVLTISRLVYTLIFYYWGYDLRDAKPERRLLSDNLTLV